MLTASRAGNAAGQPTGPQGTVVVGGLEGKTMLTTTDPADMTSEERRVQVAAIFAAGFLRLKCRPTTARLISGATGGLLTQERRDSIRSGRRSFSFSGLLPTL